MKRYLIFVGDNYYPEGGWKDYRGSLDTLEAALSLVASIPGDWWQIVDAQTGAICMKNQSTDVFV